MCVLAGFVTIETDELNLYIFSTSLGKTSVVNSNGVEVFSDLACLKEYEREFYDRLSPREIDPLLIEYQEATNRLDTTTESLIIEGIIKPKFAVAGGSRDI